MISSGLNKVGYSYVNLDDCWIQPGRDSSGRPVANTTKFPSGMYQLAQYVHSKGLLFGLYSDAGTGTCLFAGAGSLDHEVIDALTYAAWGQHIPTQCTA